MRKSSEGPLVSIIIVNYNACEHIEKCIKAIAIATSFKKEIIVVDNASTDNSIIILNKLSKQYTFKLKVNRKNEGTAYALNQGYNLSSGRFLVFIASDTIISHSYIKEAITTFERNPNVGAVAPTILKPDKYVDSVGEYITQYGFLYQRHMEGEDFTQQAEVFSAKGTGLIVRRIAFEDVKGYDESFFMCLEDTDLCWRLWNGGWRILYQPNAIVYHHTGTSINKAKDRNKIIYYLGCRNYLMMIIKNCEIRTLVWMLPLLAWAWLGLGFVLIARGKFQQASYIYKGFWHVLVNLKLVLKARSVAQKKRLTSDKDVFNRVMKKITFRQLVTKAKGW